MQRNTQLTSEEIQHIIDVYLQTKSIKKTREITGNGNKAIYKYLCENNIPLKKRGCAGGDNRKITDAELIEAAKTMSCVQIACKYNMSIERVYKRAQKLGIKTLTCNNRWYARLHRYSNSDFDSSITLDKVIEKYNGICQLCGKPVDKTDIENGHIKRNYPTVDHIKPLSKGGNHTWDNVQLAHMSCNAGKCDTWQK